MPDEITQAFASSLARRPIPVGEPVAPASMVLDEEESKAAHRERDLTFHLAKAPARFREARTEHPVVLAWARRYLQSPRSGESLLLLGPTGTGKTHAAFGALRALAEAGMPHLSWLAVSEANLLSEARGLDGTGDLAVGLYSGTALLLIDDLGTAKRTEFTVETIRRVVDYRYANNLPMIITTNLELEASQPGALDLPTAVGERTASRLAEMTTPVVFAGADRRYGGAA